MAPKSLLAAAGLAASTYAAGPGVFQKRWDTSICATNPGAAIPDSETFQLPLEGYRSDMCWDLCIGDQVTCATTTQVCYNFLGENLVFNYSSAPGYTYTEADIWLGQLAPDANAASQYTTGNGACALSADATTASCTIPYSSIITSGDVLAGMCPNGDSAGLTFFLNTNAQLVDSNNNAVNAEGRLACADYPTCSVQLPETFWELYYRCTYCPAPSSSSSVAASTPASSSAPASSAPAVSSSAPAVSSSAPAVSSSAPAVSSSAPAVSSSAPAVSSSAPAVSSSAPASSAPAASTPASSSAPASSAPAASSSAPAASSSAPASSSSAPSSSKPASSSAAASTPCTTSKPASSSSSSSIPASSVKTTSTSCTKKATPTPTTTKYCNYGTAFGHHSSCSNQFQSLSNRPSSCNRWGWFETFSSSQMNSGLNGPLYVGAGGNDLTKAVSVGGWTAWTAKDGKIYVDCSVSSGYTLGTFSVDVGCSGINTCDNNNFAYNVQPVTGCNSQLSRGFTMPNCGRTGTPYLIVQASVNSTHNIPTSQSGSFTCPAPVCQ